MGGFVGVFPMGVCSFQCIAEALFDDGLFYRVVQFTGNYIGILRKYRSSILYRISILRYNKLKIFQNFFRDLSR